jgi:glycerophosphoryl diester phosphodiesterase
MSILDALFFLAALAACGCAASGRVQRVEVIAHRGASATAPENTLAAFRLAREIGADWFELDCTLTADGEVIVIHDDKLERTTNGRGAVAGMTLADLKRLDAGAWKDARYAGEKLPTLAEALSVAGGPTGVYIELKAREDTDAARASALELVEKVVALVRVRAMERHVVVQSFSPHCCAAVKRLAPELRVALLSGCKKEEEAKWVEARGAVEAFGLDGLNLGAEGFTPERLVAVHEDGRTMAVWTVDDPAAMRRLAEWGVDGIITNLPDVCLEALGEGRRVRVAAADGGSAIVR